MDLKKKINTPLIFRKLHLLIFKDHVVVELTNPPSDSVFTEYWLYKFWEVKDERVALEEHVKTYVNFHKGEYSLYMSDIEIKRQDVRDITEEMVENPKYRVEALQRELPEIMHRIVEYETDKLFVRDEDFLQKTHNNKFIQETIDELNSSYRHGLDEATLMLSRKLVENVIIDFYRKHGDGRHYINPDRNEPKSLGGLEKQVGNDLLQLKEFTELADENLVHEIKTVRELGNNYVHNCDSLKGDEHVEKIQPRVNHIMSVFETLDKRVNKSDNNLIS